MYRPSPVTRHANHEDTLTNVRSMRSTIYCCYWLMLTWEILYRVIQKNPNTTGSEKGPLGRAAKHCKYFEVLIIYCNNMSLLATRSRRREEDFYRRTWSIVDWFSTSTYWELLATHDNEENMRFMASAEPAASKTETKGRHLIYTSSQWRRPP